MVGIRCLHRVGLMVLMMGLPLPPGLVPAQAVEISGATLFVKAPWQVELVTYYSTVGYPQPEYYITLSLDPEAGASLGRFTFRQIRGADRHFPFAPERTSAFFVQLELNGLARIGLDPFDILTRNIPGYRPPSQRPVPPSKFYGYE